MAARNTAQKMEDEVHRHLREVHELSRNDFTTSAESKGGGKIHIKVQIKKQDKRSEVNKTLTGFATQRGFTLEIAA